MSAGKEDTIDSDYLLRAMAENFEKDPVTFPITLVIKGTVWEGTVIPEGEFMRIQAATLARMTGDEKSEEVAESHAGTFREIGIAKFTDALDATARRASFIHIKDAVQEGVSGQIPAMRVKLSSVDAWTFGHATEGLS